jgi:hypothetical protein
MPFETTMPGPLILEEQYVESVASRYARMYQNKYGPFKH